MRNLASAVLAAFKRPNGVERDAPAEDGPRLTVQTRPDRPGDSYAFFWEREIRRSGGGQEKVTSTWEEFRVEIVEVRPDGLRIVRTRIASGAGSAPPGGLAYSHAWIGVPVVFDTTPSATPDRIVNWPEVKAAVLANFKARAPDATQTYEDARAYLNGAPPEFYIRDAIGVELIALGGVQPRGSVLLGPREWSDKVRGGQVLQSLDVSPQDPDRVRIEKTTRFTPRRPNDTSRSMKTVATVTVEDGWVLELETVSVDTVPGIGRETDTVKARRVSGPAREAD